MKRIYIRHADKQYKNMDSELFKHDPGITKIGVERSKKVAEKLIEQYGEPTKIISSPFRRARETAMVMNSILKTPFEEIVIDNSISEYLGNHADSPLDVTQATKVHNPPHPETFDDMKKRVKKHIDKMYKQDHDTPKGVVWIITHGLIMKQIAGHAGIKNSKSFPCLTCLCITETAQMKKSEFLIFRGDLKHEREIKKDIKVGKDVDVQEVKVGKDVDVQEVKAEKEVKKNYTEAFRNYLKRGL